MTKEVLKSIIYGILVTLLVIALIIIGSRNLVEFDAALVGYTFAVLFAAFGITYRYSMWLQRPPTAMYFKHGLKAFFTPKYLAKNIVNWFKRVISDFAFNRFIFHRGKNIGIAHWLIMWGCLSAVAITFPLVLGWVHFESLPNNPSMYQTYAFGFPGMVFDVNSITGFIIFHGLVWSSLLVIPGVMLAMRRRVSDHSLAAQQEFGEDILPLVLLFAVSITGLMLTASYTWMKGYAYDFLATLHAITVIFTLLWLPFGKLFHIFQRPAQLGVTFYKDVGQQEEQAKCRRCAQPYASLMHIEDLILVEKQLGYKYEINGNKVEHYQRICPACRRKTLAVAQGMLWQAEIHKND